MTTAKVCRCTVGKHASELRVLYTTWSDLPLDSAAASMTLNLWPWAMPGPTIVWVLCSLVQGVENSQPYCPTLTACGTNECNHTCSQAHTGGEVTSNTRLLSASA